MPKGLFYKDNTCIRPILNYLESQQTGNGQVQVYRTVWSYLYHQQFIPWVEKVMAYQLRIFALLN